MKRISAFPGFMKESYGFVFTLLPFGLSVALYCFAKIVRALVKFWRSNGIKIVVFLMMVQVQKKILRKQVPV